MTAAIKLRSAVAVLAMVITLLASLTGQGQAAPPAQGPTELGRQDKALVDRLNQETGGAIRISYHPETGQANFIGATPGRAIPQPAILGQNATAQTAARGFLNTYGKLFGLTDQKTELTLIQETALADGRAFVKFQQVYNGIPVLGGELIVQTGQRQNIISANGEILPALKLNITPQIEAQKAQQIALQRVAKSYNVNINDLSATQPELWIYDPALLGNPGRRVSNLVWRVEVTPLNLLPIRELVLVEAQRGLVALNFNQIDSARSRIIYDNANNASLGLPGYGPVRVEGGLPTGISDADLAYNYSGDTYNFFNTEHGRDSIDGAGMTMISTTRFCPNSAECPYANAFWNGSQMVYGTGFSAADDVVAHELTHGVTEHTSKLFYYYQSGAINESLSDIWGEFVDQTNGAGTDTPTVKWLMGEDVPGFGAIRDMKDPTTFYNPDSVNSLYYECNGYDSGGVHSNSGVNNKAAYLMTDGGSFNGYTVTALGLSTVADLYYEVQTNLLTSGSDYLDLYNALIQASINLGFSAAQQQEVQDALHAVYMNTQPCGDPADPPMCTTGQSPTYLFNDDLELPGAGKWTSAHITGANAWYYPATANPWGFDATYATSGTNNFWGGNLEFSTDSYLAMTANVTLPANAYMYFRHDWNFEDYWYDGGVVEYSANGGSWTDAGSLFVNNGYNGVINSGYGNPLSGRQSFVDNSFNYTASRLNLNSLAGRNVRFRFRIGADEFMDDWGWFIDDVSIYTCAAGNTPPRFLSSGLPNQSVSAGNSKNNAINLWWYVIDYESADSALTYSLCTTPDPNAGISIDSNRYIDITPLAGWQKQDKTTVCVRAADSGGLSAQATFTVSGGSVVYLPVVLKNR